MRGVLQLATSKGKHRLVSIIRLCMLLRACAMFETGVVFALCVFVGNDNSAFVLLRLAAEYASNREHALCTSFEKRTREPIPTAHARFTAGGGRGGERRPNGTFMCKLRGGYLNLVIFWLIASDEPIMRIGDAKERKELLVKSAKKIQKNMKAIES